MKTIEHLTEEQLAAYAADSLAPGETEVVERHLLQCAACRDSLPAPTPEQFWSALLADEPKREEISATANLSPAASPFSSVFSFLCQPATLGACVLILIGIFSFLIWRGASNQANPVNEISQTVETPRPENILPTAEKTPETTGGETQTIQNRENTRQSSPPRPPKTENNFPNAATNSNKPGQTENRELAQLLENTPPAVSSLRPNGETILRSGDRAAAKNSDSAPVFALIAPVGETVLEDAPQFRWQKTANATSYQISILDENFNKVLTEEVSGNSFKPITPLKRGAKYLWRVAANTAAGEIVAPQPPQPPGVFRVAAETAESRISALRNNENDWLKLAVFYANEGMLDAAHCTLKEILAKNPNHKSARRLFARVERWKKENRVAVQRCEPATATKADQ